MTNNGRDEMTNSVILGRPVIGRGRRRRPTVQRYVEDPPEQSVHSTQTNKFTLELADKLQERREKQKNQFDRLPTLESQDKSDDHNSPHPGPGSGSGSGSSTSPSSASLFLSGHVYVQLIKRNHPRNKFVKLPRRKFYPYNKKDTTTKSGWIDIKVPPRPDPAFLNNLQAEYNSKKSTSLQIQKQFFRSLEIFVADVTKVYFDRSSKTGTGKGKGKGKGKGFGLNSVSFPEIHKLVRSAREKPAARRKALQDVTNKSSMEAEPNVPKKPSERTLRKKIKKIQESIHIHAYAPVISTKFFEM